MSASIPDAFLEKKKAFPPQLSSCAIKAARAARLRRKMPDGQLLGSAQVLREYQVMR
jgi:hypothetical protein